MDHYHIYNVFLLFIVTYLTIIDTQVTFEGKGEYCQLETFNATCAEDEIIIMLSAHYGRMHSGRCITRNYGNLGCSSDVLPYLDKQCSGRSRCEISIPDPMLHKSRPCPRDFTAFLEASYQCVRVLQKKKEKCSDAGVISLEAGEGFILGAIPDNPENPSSLSCPWHISAMPGQKINLTMINFVRESYSDGQGYNHITQGQCVDVAMVAEDYRKDTLQLCPYQGRERLAYLSASNSIRFHAFSKTATSAKSNVFLWRYKAIGCPDLDVSPSMWVRREDDQMVIRCNQTEETWYLICQNGSWKGRLGNCSQPRKLVVDEVQNTESTLPYGILITVSIGVALGIFLGGVLLVVVLLLRRYRSQNRRKQEESAYDLYSDTLRKKGPEIERGYAPVVDECGHFPVPAERFPGMQSVPGHTDTCTTPDAILSTELGKDCIRMEPQMFCVHHECHIYESTRLPKPGQPPLPPQVPAIEQNNPAVRTNNAQ